MKKDYMIKCYAGKSDINGFKKEVKNIPFGCNWYGIEKNDIHHVAMGICLAMYFKFKNPTVEVYEMTEGGNKLECRIN